MATDDTIARLKALSERLERHRRQAQEVRTYIVNSHIVCEAADTVGRNAGVEEVGHDRGKRSSAQIVGLPFASP